MTPEDFASKWLEDRLYQFHFGTHLLAEAVKLGWPQTQTLPVTLAFGEGADRRGTVNSKLAFIMVPYLNSTIIEARKCFEFFGIKADATAQRLIEIPAASRKKKGKRSDDLCIEDFNFARPTLADMEIRLVHTHCGDLHGPVSRILTYADKVLAHWTSGFPGFALTDLPIAINVIIEMIRLYYYIPSAMAFPRPKFLGFQHLCE